MIFKKSAVSLAVSSILTGAAALVLLSAPPALAANNPLSTVTAVEVLNGQRVQFFDLTVNVDWDYDDANDPKRVQLGTGSNRGGGRPATVLDRIYIQNLVEQTARTLFVMTNGHHRLRNVYVFKNSKFGDNVDIRVLNVPGRANASARLAVAKALRPLGCLSRNARALAVSRLTTATSRASGTSAKARA